MKKMYFSDKGYYYRVTDYTSKSFICKLYKKIWFIPIKIYERLFIRKMSDNDAYYMAWHTAFDYEHSKLKA